MKRQMTYVLGTGILTVLMGCSHGLKPVSIDSSANPADEISMHNKLMDQAQTAQVDVLAPEHFEDSRKYFAEAKSENKKGAPSKEVFEALGYAKSHLVKANEVASEVKGPNADVLVAREKAIAAGARNLPDSLAEVDDKLTSYTDSSKVNISVEDSQSLQNEYLALELTCIKNLNLSEVRKVLKSVQDKDAEEITPKAYNVAVQKFNVAEKLIETDRHNTALITAAVAEATNSASRVSGLLDSEKASRNQTPEQRAVGLESKDIALKNSADVNSAVVASSLAKDKENKDFKKKEVDELVVKTAAESFSASEADVYRQDGLLIVRLKSMNFASGRYDLPADSMAVLAKVKKVISNFGPGEVTVEGHTDGVGAARPNQELSEHRAESVVKYFLTDDQLKSNKMNFVGYGYSKPLGTNKTKLGRSQNRRVDILIKPSSAI